MSAVTRLLDRVWFQPAPPERLATLRVLVIGFGLIWLLAGAPLLLGYAGFPAHRFEPVGVVALLDSPLPSALVIASWALAVLAGVLALLGLRYRVSAPVFALALLWVTSYRNSWGMVFHTENLLVVHALILAVVPAADAWSLDARRVGPAPSTPDPRYGWAPRLMAAVTVLAYVLAGVAKLRNAGVEWLSGDVLFGHVAWDNLRKIELGDLHSPIGAFLARHPAVFAPLAWMSMVLELGAPLALLGRRWAWAWAIGMWCFHLGVLMIMAILFAYPLSGVAFACLFAVDQPVSNFLSRRRHAKRSKNEAAAPARAAATKT